MSVTVSKVAAGEVSPNELAAWYLKHGKTDMNDPGDIKAVEEHFSAISTGATSVWVALSGDTPDAAVKGLKGKLVGLLSGVTTGVQFGNVVGPTKEAGQFKAFAVAADERNKGVGSALVQAARRGMFAAFPSMRTLYVSINVSDTVARSCYLKAGFTEKVTVKVPSSSITVLHVNRPTRVIGIQSGNAVDGIDVCVVDFQEPLVAKNSADVTGLDYNCIAFETYAWPGATRDRILAARDGKAAVVELSELNYELGRCFADAAMQLLEENDVDPATVDLVSSHGQSVCGHPHWEIGDVSVIAQLTGIPCAGDFRTADVALEGNGSPCTCTYDSIMLRPPATATKWRTNINIGGTTSMTFCPPVGCSDAPVGLDPGIGVFYMDLNAQAVLGKPYDNGGELARSGKIHEQFLAEMLAHPHYMRSELPISIGAEDFPRPLFFKWQARAKELGLSAGDFQATLTELTTRGLALAAARFGPKGKLTCQDIVVRGGVRFNSHFMDRLRWNFSQQLGEADVKLTSMDDLGKDEDSWETVMYAMFGFLCSRGLNNFVPSCTGASRACCGGKISGLNLRPPTRAFAPRTLKCCGCGAEVDAAENLALICPKRNEVQGPCHILEPIAAPKLRCRRISQMPSSKCSNPFIRYRERMFAYHLARSLGLSDADWKDMAKQLDQGIARVEPKGPGGFKQTPLKFYDDLKVWGKDESNQVGQSHKARHFGSVMLYLQTLLRAKAPAAKGLRERPLAVASCGNAALAAATVAAAVDWPIQVFIPDDAEQPVVARLTELKAQVQVCPKADNVKLGGDATVVRLREAVAKGAIPFSVQACDNSLAYEGSATLIWEAIDQLYEKGISELGTVVVHVGGGALANGIFTGLDHAVDQGALAKLPAFHTVQAVGCAPLAQCLDKLAAKLPAAADGTRPKRAVQELIEGATKTERDYMNVWPEPASLAHGILDDEVYDWPKICEGMLRTSGRCHLITDDHIREASTTAKSATGIEMCLTGASGYAGILSMRSQGVELKEPTLVVFSGHNRGL